MLAGEAANGQRQHIAPLVAGCCGPAVHAVHAVHAAHAKLGKTEEVGKRQLHLLGKEFTIATAIHTAIGDMEEVG